MPSSKNPRTTVQAGPGRLPSGVVPANSLLFSPGGGTGAGLESHLIDPTDAHMASAIGIPTNNSFGDPLLSIVGGTLDGESLLDFVEQLKDLVPPRPNYLGYNDALGINSGIPDWGQLNASTVGTGTSMTAGYKSGTATQPSHFIVPTTATSFALGGMIFPADRGVLALYRNTDGNFFNSATTTLVAALSLRSVGGPAGIPSANFNPAIRAAKQLDYTNVPGLTGTFNVTNGSTAVTASLNQSGLLFTGSTIRFASQPEIFYQVQICSGTTIVLTAIYTGVNAAATTAQGLDQIGLTWRLPYVKNFVALDNTAPYSNYAADFSYFQLATYAVASQAVAAGGSQNWLMVHWKETYALTLLSILPSNLTVGNLIPAKCYSATPSASNFDDNTAGVYNTNRHYVFNDASSATAPGLTTFTSNPVVTPATTPYSGVSFINAAGLTFNVTLQANNLFNNAFETGTVASPPDVPLQFMSGYNPMAIDFAEFGGATLPLPYTSLHSTIDPGVPYSISAPPAPADTGEYLNASLNIVTPTNPYTVTNALGYSTLKASFHKPFTNLLSQSSTLTKYLFNTFPVGGGQVGSSTSTFEGFVDEYHRYDNTHVIGVTDPIVPVGAGVKYDSTVSLAAEPLSDNNSAQIIGNCLCYPGADFTTIYAPAGPNYSNIPMFDGVNHFRRFTRCFDTGLARVGGRLRIRFLPGYGDTASFTRTAWDGTEQGGHQTGGMIIQCQTPGDTMWGDLGWPFGNPGLVTFGGCATATTTVGPDIFIAFSAFSTTANNGSGEFPLFVRVTFLNSLAGLALRLDEMEWLAP